jgi:hypothetical protein
VPDDEDHPTDGELHEITFPIPETADDAWRQLVQAAY